MKTLNKFNDWLAVKITSYFGSMWAFYVLIAWMFLWMAAASNNLWLFAHDKYPFQFLLFLSNLVQLFALPVIIVGQNVISRKQDAHRAQTEAAQSQHEELMEQHATHLEEMEQRIMDKLEAK